MPQGVCDHPAEPAELRGRRNHYHRAASNTGFTLVPGITFGSSLTLCAGISVETLLAIGTGRALLSAGASCTLTTGVPGGAGRAGRAGNRGGNDDRLGRRPITGGQAEHEEESGKRNRIFHFCT